MTRVEGYLPIAGYAAIGDGLAGSVQLRWRVEPRFGYGAAETRIARRGTVPIAVSGRDALAVCSWGAGEPELGAREIGGRCTLGEGEACLLALSVAHQEPLVAPDRSGVEARL